jgi:hypothetical protein
MKAAKESIPVEKPSTTQSTARPKGQQDGLWAEIRRIKALLSTIEVQLNAVRTIATRADRRTYREEAKETKAELPPEAENVPGNGHAVLDSALWG